MTDSSQTKESGISVKPDDAKKAETEKPKTDGGAQGSESPKTTSEKKWRVNEEIKSTLIFTAVSAIAGYASFLLTPVLNPTKPVEISTTSLLIVLAAMIAVFFGTNMIVQKLVGKKDMKWIMGNGGAIYLFLWFVTWIIFYNAM